MSELNTRLDTTRKSFLLKQSEVEFKEKELRDYTESYARLHQEKIYLNEKQHSLKIDTPFAEEYRNDSAQLKEKQLIINQLKADMERMESQINTTRSQLAIIKSELDDSKTSENDIQNENNRLESLLDMKRPQSYSSNSSSFQGNQTNTNSTSNTVMFRNSLSTNNIRSATPKGMVLLS